jgi:hypothetical protein
MREVEVGGGDGGGSSASSTVVMQVRKIQQNLRSDFASWSVGHEGYVILREGIVVLVNIRWLYYYWGYMYDRIDHCTCNLQYVSHGNDSECSGSQAPQLKSGEPQAHTWALTSSPTTHPLLTAILLRLLPPTLPPLTLHVFSPRSLRILSYPQRFHNRFPRIDPSFAHLAPPWSFQGC